ncbi:hypothetical protein [Lysobacter sp. P5_B9]
MIRTIKRTLWIAVLALSPFCCVAQVSPTEAQTLPLRALAKKVLGTAGSLMIDVDRPTWGERSWRMPPSTPWPPSGPPPLHDLRFFGRGVVTGSQFGMCGSDWVTVHFEESGEIESLQAERHYGVEGPIYRAPGHWTYEESERICSSVKTTKTYFPAPDAQSALEIALYLDAIGDRGPFAHQSFAFSCTGICRNDRALLRELRLGNIDEARQIDCVPTKVKLPSCFELTVGDNKIGPYPKTFRVYGSNYMNKVIITAVSVDVGSTLE